MFVDVYAPSSVILVFAAIPFRQRKKNVVTIFEYNNVQLSDKSFHVHTHSIKLR